QIIQLSQAIWDQRQKQITANDRKNERSGESLPGFCSADMRHHLVPADAASDEISSHVTEFSYDYQVQNVELPGSCSGWSRRGDVDDFSEKIEEPGDVQNTEESVGHGLERRLLDRWPKHLPSENPKKKNHQHHRFKVIG